MNKQAYLAALERTLSGLPADQIADILRDYDQHFIDAMESGRSDEATARALGDPRKIALEFKAMTHLDAFQSKRSLPNFGRMALALVYMAGFNIFLLPFMLVAPLMLLSLYLASASFFVGGAMITASGLLGIDKIAFEHDGRRMTLVVAKDWSQVGSKQSAPGIQISLYPYGVHFIEEPLAIQRTEASDDAPSGETSKLLFGATYLAAGIALFFLSRKFAGWVGSGTRRYLSANINILRGAQTARA